MSLLINGQLLSIYRAGAALLVFLFLFFSQSGDAKESFKSFKSGQGARYEMQVMGGKANLTAVVVESTSEILRFELFFQDLQLRAMRFWQQFKMDLKRKPAQIVEGYIKMPMLGEQTYRLPKENLEGIGQFRIEEFLLVPESALSKYKVGSKQVTYQGKKLKLNHYKLKKKSHHLEFWMSSLIQPFGLYELHSKGQSAESNFKLRLINEMKGVKASIQPAKAVDMDPQLKALLPKSPADLSTKNK